ncbi:MAG: DUF4189 domain-containing protein [Burkholderiales bacterium]|nr:DUF4189 domain-containing protein [Burkholderiales bacterium]
MPLRTIVVALCLVLACAGASQAATQSTRKNAWYGAIALERGSDAVGYAVQRRTSREARLEALHQCGAGGCEVVLRFAGDCGAVARPRPARGAGNFAKFSSARGITRAEAQTRALRACGRNCEIAVWACNR